MLSLETGNVVKNVTDTFLDHIPHSSLWPSFFCACCFLYPSCLSCLLQLILTLQDQFRSSVSPKAPGSCLQLPKWEPMQKGNIPCSPLYPLVCLRYIMPNTDSTIAPRESEFCSTPFVKSYLTCLTDMFHSKQC